MNPSDHVSMKGILKFLKYLSIYPFPLVCRHAAAIELLGLMEEDHPELTQDEDFKNIFKLFCESSKGDFWCTQTLDKILQTEFEELGSFEDQKTIALEIILKYCPQVGVEISQGDQFDGFSNKEFNKIELVLPCTMSFVRVKYLALHECGHYVTNESGHNDRLYSVLIPLAKENKIPYSIVLDIEQGEWWNSEYRYSRS